MENKDSSLDLLGIKPIAKAIDTTVEKSFDGIEGFLKIVCVPVLEEIGLYLKDNVRHWRLNNILRIIEKAKGKLNFDNGQLQIQAHPRVALAIIENGSLNDNDEVQEMWAGLFVSSCNSSGQDDGNLIFIDLLKQLTNSQARILKYSCENSQKIISKHGFLLADDLKVELNTLIEISGIKEIHRIDRELDHLRSISLISTYTGGFNADEIDLKANISPTPLALNLYTKCNGHNSAPSLYWHDNLITQEELEEKIKNLKQS